jgi:hypothetical protein
MKALCAMAAVGLSMMALMGSASAQPYGGPDYRYREPDYRYREPGYGYRERRSRYENRTYGFDEREYLRCNRDVLRAVRRGQMQSGFAHYQMHGRYEGRPLSCW